MRYTNRQPLPVHFFTFIGDPVPIRTLASVVITDMELSSPRSHVVDNTVNVQI